MAGREERERSSTGGLCTDANHGPYVDTKRRGGEGSSRSMYASKGRAKHSSIEGIYGIMSAN